jgi:hypothetical protein
MTAEAGNDTGNDEGYDKGLWEFIVSLIALRAHGWGTGEFVVG